MRSPKGEIQPRFVLSNYAGHASNNELRNNGVELSSHLKRGLPREARRAKRGGGGGSRIRLTVFSANSDMSGIPFNF
jgi:hypothetical protein